MSSDIMFCDYSPIRLLWGKCKGGQSDQSGKCDEIDDTSDPHVVLSPSTINPPGSSSQTDYYILSQGTPTENATSRFSIKNDRTGLNTGVQSNDTETDTYGEWGYYVSLDNNAGYCSLIDDNSQRRLAYDKWNQDYFTDFFFKTINLDLAPKGNELSSEDPGSPSTFRDG
jgi:hypothetical protein